MPQTPDKQSDPAGFGEIMLAGMHYHLKTFGCQMNEHDSERIAGMLDSLGAIEVTDPLDSDILIFMTCCVREKADERLMGQVASCKNDPAPHGRRIVCVGGCIGQRDGEKLTRELDNVDVVFGTQNVAHLPGLITAAMERPSTPQVEIIERGEGFISDLPGKRAASWHAWLPITSGCDNFCSYCIVPYVRGRERSRTIEDIGSELSRLASQKVAEVTLLGQNVNSYGRDLYGEPRFFEVLELAATCGIPRVRFATSHPKDLTHETIEVMGTYETIMPQLHLPVQSGSDRILQAMNRKYTREDYLQLVEEVKRVCGDIAFSTDIIVGFPGETQDDFDATLSLVREVGYSQAFTFIYSKREGTPAARMVDDTPREVIQSRFDSLVELIQESAFEQNRKELGVTVPVLIEGRSKHDPAMLSGRSPKNQMVHAPLPAGADPVEFIGRLFDVAITATKTWYLTGDLVS